ncbi:hypothetical protein NDU88_009253 [Pleurodeles waltl]|uniref:Uncharacterized protein n=1 Tax=Pleurodeles waltl TaxID=8319 RepID=A0AAV7NYH8_PLEWA|nr:hypothetical protein NDU88_009253 [Pleurodeles waltl]
MVTDVTLQTTAALGMDRGKQCSRMPAGDGCCTAEHGRTGHGWRKAMQPQALLVMDVTLQTTAALGMDRGKQCSLMPAGDGCGTADHSRTGHGRRKTMQPHACWCQMWHRRPRPHWAWTEESNAASCLLVTDVALQTTAALGMDGGKQCSLMPAGDGCGTTEHSYTCDFLLSCCMVNIVSASAQNTHLASKGLI